ncbi:hypothetical protein KAT08_01995 [Candidatus Babeliales bacterium]|nr:hypothetical protein [Candidatus Babeliales bacterium]
MYISYFNDKLHKLKHKINFILKKRKINDIESILIKIRKDVSKIVKKKKIKNKKRILFGLSFSAFEPNKVHDFLLSQSLILRGAEIIPVICGAVQEGQCSVYGGVWGSYTGIKEKDILISKKNCDKCIKSDLKLWKVWAGIDPVFLKNYLKDIDREKIRKIVESCDVYNYKDLTYDGILVGKFALNSLRNNELVIDVSLIKNNQKLFKAYLFNVIIMVDALKNLLDDIKPDVIITNDTFYYPWSILEKLALRKGIIFHCNSPGGRKNSWSYSTNKQTYPTTFNLKVIWKSWEQRNLSVLEEELVEDHLDNLISGNHMPINTAIPLSSKKNNFKINFNKPTVLLVSNICWDLSVLDSDLFFNSMFDWILKTVKFFIDHKEFQLIIKPHPAEEIDRLPTSKQKVSDEIKKHFKHLPENIILLNPKTQFSVYDLFPHVSLGLVYTSTVGMEMAIKGISVVTCANAPYRGKGFTYDPKTEKEYFFLIKDLLKKKEDLEEQKVKIKLAKKFLYLNHFVVYSNFGFFDWNYTSPLSLKISCAKDLMPGKNVVLDYICDSIMNDLLIIDKNRFPPVVRNGEIVTKCC